MSEQVECKVCDNDRRFVVGTGQQADIIACPACRGVNPETLTADERADVEAACREAGVTARWDVSPSGMDGRITPGTEPTSEARRDLAILSLGYFLAELWKCGAAADRLVLDEALDGAGRWGARISSLAGRGVSVRMPGHEPVHLRYRGREGQCAYDFPRVIVSGLPLLWGHALAACARLLSDDPTREHEGAATYLRRDYFGGGR